MKKKTPKKRNKKTHYRTEETVWFSIIFPFQRASLSAT
jgi:hypothetical protein